MALSWGAIAMMFGAVPARRNVVTPVANVVCEEKQDVATDGKTPAPTVKKPIATDDADDFQEITPAEAVAIYFADCMYEAAGGWLTFRNVARGYANVAKRHGWPPVSDKRLSQLLRDNHGCATRATQKRDANGRRLSIVIFPECEAPS